MAIVFAIRGDSLNARYSSGGKAPILLSTGSESDPSSGADAGTGVLGATILDFVSGGTGLKLATYPGKNNFPASGGLSFVARVKPSYSGSPASISGVFAFYHFRNSFFFFLEHATDGTLICRLAAINGSTAWNFATTAWSPVSGTVYDIAFTWDGSTTSNKVRVWIDGVVVGQATAGVNFATAIETPQAMIIGASHNDSVCLSKLNEFVIWDSEINPAAGGLGLIGSTRAAFVTVAAFDALNSTDPGIANVEESVTYYINGVLYTGTMTPTLNIVDGEYDQMTIITGDQTSDANEGVVVFIDGRENVIKVDGSIQIVQGEAFSIVLKLRRNKGYDPVDLSAATAITVAFPNADGTWHTESLAGGGVTRVSGPSDGDISVAMTAAETALLKAGAYQNVEITYTISGSLTAQVLPAVLEIISSESF